MEDAKKKHLFDTGKKIQKEQRFDGWKNILTGINVAGKDKRVSTLPYATKLDQKTVEIIYEGDDVAAKIINKLPFDGTRKWIELEGDTKEKEIVELEMIRLDIKEVFRKAWMYGRLYGTAVVILVTKDSAQNLIEPLRIKDVREIQNLIVLHRWEIQPGTYITKDITSANFGMPEFYTIASDKISEQVNVHHSRIIRFEGRKVGEQSFRSNNYFNDSILSAIHQVLIDYANANSSLASVLVDFRQMVYTMQGLADKIGNPETEEKIKDRISIMNLMRSILNTIVIDSEDELEDRTMNLAGLKDVILPVQNRLVVASGYPHTVMLGDSPSGLGASGRAEEDVYYDEVSSVQEDVLRKPIQFIIELIKNTKSIKDVITFEFVPLKQKSPKEDAEIKKLMAEADEKYIANGTLSAEEVAESRFGGQKYSTNTELNQDFRPTSEDISIEENDNDN